MLRSIGKLKITLGETVKTTKFTPPSLMKATPIIVASNTNDVCPMSVSDADDVTMTSSSQDKGVHINYSTLPLVKTHQRTKLLQL